MNAGPDWSLSIGESSNRLIDDSPMVGDYFKPMDLKPH